jgi:hypothetical protein
MIFLSNKYKLKHRKALSICIGGLFILASSPPSPKGEGGEKILKSSPWEKISLPILLPAGSVLLNS